MFEVHQSDARSVLDAAEVFLRSRPVEHNVIGQVLEEQAVRPSFARFWYVTHRDAVVGAAMQAPAGARVSLTPMPPAAARSLARAIAPPLPGVYADAQTAAAFAGEWTILHHVRTTPIDVQILYECRDVQAVAEGVPGSLRRAEASERSLLVEWTRAFFAQANRNPERMVDRDLERGDLWVWETDRSVAMARVARPLGGVAHILTVYTPDENRTRGYGTALVTSLSRSLLADGFRCVLAARLDNPTANGIYARIGYEPVGTLLTLLFQAGSGPE